MAHAPTPLDPLTLVRLDAAAQRGVDPARTRERLHALRALTDGAMDELEASLPRFCADAARDVAAASRHLLGAGGKRVRPLLVLLAARAAAPDGAPRGRRAALLLAAAAELVHNATLLHDDVIDDGRMRRGRPAARVVWGNTVSVLGGDFLLARALELVGEADAPGALPALLFVIRRMVEGEALQLDRRGRLDADERTYHDVVDAKTAALFAWCGRAGACAAAAPPPVADALERYGFHLGRAFQIVDDCLDLTAGDAVGKDVLRDLREGKLTLPVLEALRADAALARALAAAADEPDEAAAAEVALRVAREAVRGGGLSRARAVAAGETRLAVEALGPVPPGPYREALAGIALELAERGF